jgi:thiamine biosynthesis lipoprotein
LVEIRATARRSAPIETVIDKAFAAVAQVHALMNAHDAASELRRLMAAPCRRVWRVHPWTWQVLAAARKMADLSDGAFDFTLCGRWRDLEIISGNRVRLRGPLPLDLSGIAKGFAVDTAVAVLRRAGMRSGAVNAGGDLRVFGPGREPLHVRCPDEPGRLLSVGFLANEAAATSGNYFDPPETGRLRLPNPAGFARHEDSVTVRARTCMLADGLTKVVAVQGLRRAKPVLDSYGATALVLQTNGCRRTSDETEYAA